MNPTERAMYDFWGKWFAQPLEEKMKHLRQPGRGGYYPPASEAPGFTGKPDPKEYFHFRADRETSSAPGDLVTRQVFWECYSKAQEWLKDHALEGLCALPAPNHVLRIIHYPPNPEPVVGQAHRDFDLLTVSVEGTAPGLEVFDEDAPYDGPAGEDFGAWIPQETGVQVGEMLEIYTGGDGVARPSKSMGQLQATTHRVRTAPNTDRLKAVFFYLPPNDFELRPGFTAGDYLKDVLSKAGTYGIGAK